MTGKSKINVKSDDYYVGNPPLPSGICLFKVLVQESHLDSDSTSGIIRTSLSNLDSKIHDIGNDIIQFNSHVQMLLDSSKARGDTNNDLLTNLFKGYAACSDKNFVKCIGDKKEAQEYGKELLTSEGFIFKTVNRYKTLNTKE